MKAGFRQIVERARAHGVCIIGGDDRPYVGSDYYKPDADNERTARS